MAYLVPLFEAAQNVARAIFGPAYGQSWTPPDADDLVAVNAAKAKQREQEMMSREACDRLYNGFKNGALTLLIKSPNGDILQASNFVLQYANPYRQVSAGRIIKEDYGSDDRVKALNDHYLFVSKNELDAFIRAFGGDVNASVCATASSKTGSYPNGKEGEAYTWYDLHSANYVEGMRNEKQRMYADCSKAIGIPFATAKTYGAKWTKLRIKC
ncbi:hypothetical protein [Roseomonas genomospecies 6]|uniref:hypothetical protein n=1 Tax=Roseomonas genomospecies 6 TaxID=214106 RepID=UPI0011F1B261|nr:hypothetical protein [Roseomonas genomospecies 6]